MFKLSCPIATLAMPPVRQTMRVLCVAGVPHELTVLPTGAVPQCTADLGLRVVPGSYSAALAGLSGQRPESGEWGYTMDGAVRLGLRDHSRPFDADLVEVAAFAGLVDAVFQAVQNESAHQLSTTHGDLTHYLANLDKRCGRFDGCEARRALFVPLLQFLFRDCGMPSAMLENLAAAVDAAESPVLQAADDKHAAYLSEYLGGQASPKAAAAAGFRGPSDEPLFAVIHKVLRARTAGAARTASAAGRVEVVDPLRGRARSSSMVGQSASAQRSTMPM